MVPGTNPLVKTHDLSIQTSEGSLSRPSPGQPDCDGHIEEDREVRPEIARREAVQRAQPCLVQPTPGSLVGERRVDVPIAHDETPAGERRANDRPDVFGPCRGEEEHFRLGTHRSAREQPFPDRFTYRRATRFTGEQDRETMRFQPCREQLALRRFTSALRPLEGDEPAHQLSSSR
ncbi:hypothetical protein HRbin27_01011 [bacterium HR27]|nr:hypothetical protein HRbin27_01011 [bacterium HR27]